MKQVKVFLAALLALGLVSLTVQAEVVINELYYDHPGTDTGHEFVELYNNGTADVDLTGWQIQWGGTDFTYGTYDFPYGTIIYAGDYLLIGGTETANDFGVTPDLVYNFNFQNGGGGSGPTDAVRIFDLVNYHDTCLYDSPNTNNLEGDANNPAGPEELNPDVASGHSLSRITVGYDTNTNTDWEDLDAPTPTASSYSITISDIADIRPNDSTGVPLYLDSLVTITGIITCASELGTNGPAYMYDNTGAIAVYDGTVSSSGIAIGDSVIVTGWVGFYNGLTEIVDEPVSGTPDVAFQIISSGHEVVPVEGVPTDVNEDNEGYLMRINGATFVEQGLFDVGTFHAYVGTDTFVVYIDYDSGIAGDPIPVGECDVVGQVGQYDNSSPYFDGHQLIPRFPEDIISGGLVGPTIEDTEPIPYLPDDMEDVVINSVIYDDISVTSAYVYYDVGAGWVQLELFDDGLHNDGAAGDSIYGNTIPGQAAGTWVNFYIEATDNEANTTWDPPNAPTGYYSYEHHDYSVVTDISVVREADSTGYPVNIDGLYTIHGYITVADEFGYAGPAYIQSSTTGVPGEGIAIYDGVVSSGVISVGDEVYVTGWVGFYNGLTQIVDAPYNSDYNPVFEVISSGNTLTPLVIDDLDDVGEDYEGLLVEVRGVRFTETGLFSGSTNYDIVNGADTSRVRIDSDTNIPGVTIPEIPTNIIGAMSQYDYSSPYTSGYQLLPRYDTDLYTPDVYLTAIPTSTPIQIPATGGSFDYNIDVYNNGTTSADIAVNIIAELPTGSWYYLTPTPITLTAPAGWHANRLKTRDVPGGAPAGVYSYRLTVEDPVTFEILTSDGFPFEKLETGEGEWVENWDSRWLTDWLWEPINGETETASGLLPDDYALDQNYPNPFNPVTTIRYALPEAGTVRLQVFNLRGQLVATVVDGYRAAGYHEVSFDASNLASGLYLYRLQAGDFTETGKMMLLK